MIVPRVSERVFFAGMVSLALLTGIAGSLGAPLVPMISREEGVALSVAQWSLTGSLLVAAVTAPVVGRIGMGRRRRPVMIAMLVLAAVGAVVCALPTGMAGIIVGRCLQGLAYSVGPLIFAMARDVMPEERMGSSLATLSVVNAVAAGVGFPLVAFTAGHLGLHGAFWGGAVLMLVVVGIALAVVPDSDEHVPGRVDAVGATLMGAGTFAVLLVVSRGGEWGYASPVSLGLLVAGVVLLAVSGVWFTRAPDPLVDLRLARLPAVFGAHVATVLVGAGMFVLLSVVMVIAQNPVDDFGLGRSVEFAGLLLAPYAVASVVGNRAALKAARWLPAELVVPLGCAVYAVSMLSLWRWHVEPWHLVVAMVLGGVASGMTFNSVPGLLVRAIPAHETGSVMGVNVVVRFAGFALGSALALALLEGFGGVAGRASLTGFQAACLAGAGICALGAVLSAFLLRRRPVVAG